MVQTERFQAVKNFLSANSLKKESKLYIHPVFLLELIEQTEEMKRLNKQIIRCRFSHQRKKKQHKDVLITPQPDQNSDNSISGLLSYSKCKPESCSNCDFKYLSLGKFVQIEDQYKESQVNPVSLIASYIRKSECGSSLVRDVSVLSLRRDTLSKLPLRRQGSNDSESEFLSFVERDKGRLSLSESLLEDDE